jgi:membrane protease YdiL (CAAX protease family)
MQRFCRYAEDDVSEEPQATPEEAKPASSGGGWGEVAAVLAAGVFPNLAWAIVHALDPEPPWPLSYWAHTLTLTTQSVCTAFIVLYLLHCSGEKWERFGLVRPRLSDFLLLAPALLLMDWMVWELRWMLIPRLDSLPASTWLPKPRYPADYAMMVVKHAANAFAEELVTRAYLITRLEGLLKSPAAAVLLAAVAFASYHAYQKMDGLLEILLVGVTWGMVYLAVRRLWPFVFAHALFNVLIELR